MEKFAIIIPVKRVTENLKKCITEIKKMEGVDYKFFIAFGDKSPAEMRDEVVKELPEEYTHIAFIDDDAYPDKNWLFNALNWFSLNPNLAGVCGPGLLPPNSPIKEVASDLILRFLPFSYRVVGNYFGNVSDYPTFNLILRRDWVDKVGGFCCQHIVGEDTLICKKITALGGQILYTPNVIVYHKRRPLFRPFLQQVKRYAKQRGEFFWSHELTSYQLIFALPSLFLIGLVLTILTYGFWFLRVRFK